MFRRMIPLLVVAVTAGLTTAAIYLLPETLYFPVATLSAPSGRQATFLESGRTDRPACEHVLAELVNTFTAICGDCRTDLRCVHGLPADRRRALSHARIAQPSARALTGTLTVVFSAADPQAAMDACRQTERASAAYPVESRVRCFPPGATR
jgi:hypothetical protein